MSIETIMAWWSEISPTGKVDEEEMNGEEVAEQ